MNRTIAYSNKVNGWTAYHSFIPQYMIGMNNKMYSFNNGELWQHHSDNVPRNTYYGEHHPSKVVIVMNENPSDVKFLKSISLESNSPWDVNITAYEQGNNATAEGIIHKDEFVKKEGIYYAHSRRNEDSVTFDNKSAYGLGVVIQNDDFTLKVQGENYTLSIGDLVSTEDFILLGEVMSVVYNDGFTIISLNNRIDNVVDQFIIGVKSSRVEGSMLRGYAFKYELINEGHERAELYAVNSEVEKSYM